MSTNRRLVSIGYPIGRMKVNGEDRYIVECEDYFHAIDSVSYMVWSASLVIPTNEQLHIQMKKYPFQDVQGALERLVGSGLIIQVELENQSNSYDALKLMRPQRQGIGMGLDNKGNYVVKHNKMIPVPFLIFLVWQYSNGNRTIKEIEQLVVSSIGAKNLEVDKEILRTVLGLMKNNLIFLNRKG